MGRGSGRCARYAAAEMNTEGDDVAQASGIGDSCGGAMEIATGSGASHGAGVGGGLSLRGQQSSVVARGGGEQADELRDGGGAQGQESVAVEKRGDFAAVCRWTLAQFAKVKARALWSRYFEVGGYDCRLLVYPRGDSQALPGYLSIYLQVTDPRGTSAKWDCFASYRLCVLNQRDESKSIQRDSWHRFSGKKKSHGWCDFTPSSTVLDPKAGFLANDAVLITAEILVLHESISFSRENEMATSVGPVPEVLSGKFTWRVHNLSLFKEMIKTQKIMSPVFPAGECNLRLSVYQSSVNNVDYLSMCLESKDTDKSVTPERSCWCLFRMSVLNQRQGMNHIHRDSYGRFAADNKSGDNTSLGWNDYMRISDFVTGEMGFLVDDTAVFSASFHVIKETSTFSKNITPNASVGGGGGGGAGRAGGAKKSDGFHGKFVWRIENFTRLKDLLKKRKITGLCIKSRRFQVGNRDCRLIVYPRGQSQPPCHLSMFLEVTDPRSTNADWSCFVSHRLSVVNQRFEDRSVTKESQNRYSKAAKDWGWREFVTLTSLFDQDSGFLVADTVVFSAEVLILKETSTMLECPEGWEGSPAVAANAVLAATAASGTSVAVVGTPVVGGCEVGRISNGGTFTWRVENFLAFKDIMETRKIFSKFFQAGNCELRIGVYESFDTLCIYLESDCSTSNDLDRNFWVHYRIAVVNQKYADRTVWKESSICTKTWNNSVLQFMKVSDMLEVDAGFLVRDTVVFICEVLDVCPWFDFADLEVLVSDDEQDALSTDPDEILDTDSEEVSGDEEDIFRSLLERAGFHLSFGDSPPLILDPSQLQVTLREKLLMDAGAVAAFLAGLRMYLDDPAKVKRLLMPTKAAAPSVTTVSGPAGMQKGLGCGINGKGQAYGVVGGQAAGGGEATSPSLMNLLMGVKVLQQAIVDLLLDIMVECCTEGGAFGGSSLKGADNGNNLFANTGVASMASGGAAPAVEGKATRTTEFGSRAGASNGAAAAGAAGVSERKAGGGSPSSLARPVDVRLESGADSGEGGQCVSSDSSISDGVGMGVGVGIGMVRGAGGGMHGSRGSANGSGSGSGGGSSPMPPEPPGQEPLKSPTNCHVQKSAGPRWPEQSDELLGLIVDSLRTLDSVVTQGCPEPRRRPQSAQKIALVLQAAPSHLHQDLIGLVPKLVDAAEHPIAAQALLERLRVPDADPATRMPVLASLSQLEVGPDVWDHVFRSGLETMVAVDDDLLATAVSIVFKAAAEVRALPLAARAVREKLKKQGPAVSPRVLEMVRMLVCTRLDVAEALLQDIDSDCERSEDEIVATTAPLVFGDRADDIGASVSELSQVAAERAAAAAAVCWRVADVDMLVEMLTVPQLRVDAQRVFERAIARGAFGEQSVVMVLERRQSQRLIMDPRVGGTTAGGGMGLGVGVSIGLPVGVMDNSVPIVSSGSEEDDDFPVVLGLAEALAASQDVRVREFVSTLYAVMFKVYGDEGCRERMLRGLVERATSSSSGPSEVELGMDILTFLVREEEGTARPVLSMMRETAEVAHSDRSALWQQLRATEEELNRMRVDRQADITRLNREKGALQSKVGELEAAQARAKGEARAEIEKLTREKKELQDRVREMDNQLEWARAERDEEVGKLVQDKRMLQDRLREAENQLNQIKNRKRDELKRVVKEKNVLAERLKNAESARKRFDEELKRFATETITRDEVRQSLEDEVRRLNAAVGQTKGGLREKEEQVMRCEAYIDGMEAKLHAHQDYIQTLEASLQEEMSRHAPLYGAGLEGLSLSELETLARIHEEGLRQVRTLQQQRQAESVAAVVGSIAVGGPDLPGSAGPPMAPLYATAPPIAVGLPPLRANGIVHGNGHLNGGHPWYPSA
ncbi:hypothetical protein CBR_g20432 [Chara braunii]|uniref:MATH domain-containing protein n=1 Tax=Chara braunii TaxID=69332 RepID=A0A388JUC4_CHABU|nr:hypothetical protein CBR_g20432 [Chara braunii]|eukprot:GBG61401.1 hypothetical protein CBR_g20432 [Chara braunii]